MTVLVYLQTMCCSFTLKLFIITNASLPYINQANVQYKYHLVDVLDVHFRRFIHLARPLIEYNYRLLSLSVLGYQASPITLCLMKSCVANSRQDISAIVIPGYFDACKRESRSEKKKLVEFRDKGTLPTHTVLGKC